MHNEQDVIELLKSYNSSPFDRLKKELKEKKYSDDYISYLISYFNEISNRKNKQKASVTPKILKYYEWEDIQLEICKKMNIKPDHFRDYHKVVGGSYKDLWHVMCEELVTEIHNGMYTHVYVTDLVFTGKDKWKNKFIEAWNSVITELSENDEEEIVIYFWW